jgi:hypothetical protein
LRKLNSGIGQQVVNEAPIEAEVEKLEKETNLGEEDSTHKEATADVTEPPDTASPHQSSPPPRASPVNEDVPITTSSNSVDASVLPPSLLPQQLGKARGEREPPAIGVEEESPAVDGPAEIQLEETSCANAKEETPHAEEGLASDMEALEKAVDRDSIDFVKVDNTPKDEAEQIVSHRSGTSASDQTLSAAIQSHTQVQTVGIYF